MASPSPSPSNSKALVSITSSGHIIITSPPSEAEANDADEIDIDTNVPEPEVKISSKSIQTVKSHQSQKTKGVRSALIRQRPKILRHYEICSYVLYGVSIVRSSFKHGWKDGISLPYFFDQACFIIYVGFISELQFGKEFHMQYGPITELLAYVSYDTQCPIIGITGKFVHLS